MLANSRRLKTRSWIPCAIAYAIGGVALFLLPGCDGDDPFEGEEAKQLGKGTLVSQPKASVSFTDYGSVYGCDVLSTSQDAYLSLKTMPLGGTDPSSTMFAVNIEYHNDGAMLFEWAGSAKLDYGNNFHLDQGYWKVGVYTKSVVPVNDWITVGGCIGGTTKDFCFAEDNRMNVIILSENALASPSVYALYGASYNVDAFKQKLNRVLAQSVCRVDNVYYMADKPNRDWDLNGNGQLDVYTDDPGNSMNEFPAIKSWALSNRYWSTSSSGIIVLDKPINPVGGTLFIGGVTDENFSVLGSDAGSIVAVHEYLHQDMVGDLGDISSADYIDNVMYETVPSTSPGQLAYRSISTYKGEQRQWDILNSKQ